MKNINSLQAYVTLDLETRSRVDLLKQGGYRYMEDESTELLTACVRVHVGANQVEQFTFSCLETAAALESKLLDLKDLLNKVAGTTCGNIWWVAHNADGFERLAFYEAPFFVGSNAGLALGENTPERWQWIDTATLCRMHGLPGGLGKAAKLLGVESKQSDGVKLIRLLCKPRKDGEFNAPEDFPNEMAKLLDYNIQDVLVMEQVAEHLDLGVAPDYIRDAEALRELNDRGVPIDAGHVRDCARAVELKRDAARERLFEMTHGRVTSEGQNARLIAEFDTLPVPPTSFDQAARADIAAALHVLPSSLAVTRGLEIISVVEEVKSASLGKYAAIEERSTQDGTHLCGNYLHAGAGQTSRYSSTGVQIHNLNRGSLSEADFTELAWSILPSRSEVSSAHLAGGVRQSFCKRGHKWVIGDWTAVEARVLPWLAGCDGGREKLNAHTDPERDVYREAAQAAGLDYDKNRTEGKVIELALGFGGGAGALESMAAGYGVDLTSLGVKPKAIVNNWRKQNLWAVQFWNALEEAAEMAVRFPGEEYGAGLVTYRHDRTMLNGKGALIALLPCGTQLVYPKARMKGAVGDKGEEGGSLVYSPAKYNGTTEVSLWRGLLAENVTQALAASLLRMTLSMGVCRRLARLHTHDEIGLLAPNDGDAICMVIEELRYAMTSAVAPSFPGLPLDVEIHSAFRYQKDAW